MSPELYRDLAAVAPLLWLTVAVLVTVVADLVLGARGRTVVTLLGVAGCAMALHALLDGGPGHGVSVRAFGLLAVDTYAGFFQALIVAGTGVLLLHTLVFRGMEDSSRNETVPMLLGTALGGSLVVATDHLVMLLLGLELLSLNSYLLAGWQRRERRSSEAALKYLVYGALASALMVFGFSLFFGLSGSMWLGEIGRAAAAAWSGSLEQQAVVVAATALVLVGMGFKIAAFPFHFWAPDVYEGSPTPVTTFLSVASKAAGFGLLVRFVGSTFLGPAANPDWLANLGGVLAVLAAVTMTYGNVTAVLQSNVKRLLAYSSIAHAGYLLMGVAAMASGLPGGAEGGSDALLFYLATYYVATLGAFGCVMHIANRFGAEDLEDWQGLGWSAPFAGGLLVLFLVSLTGLPPTAGFVGKWMLFKACLDNGLAWLAVVAALNAVVSLFYYFKLARALFLRGDWEVVPGLPTRGLMPALAHASLLLLAVVTLWWGLAFDGLSEWVAHSLPS